MPNILNCKNSARSFLIKILIDIRVAFSFILVLSLFFLCTLKGLCVYIWGNPGITDRNDSFTRLDGSLTHMHTNTYLSQFALLSFQVGLKCFNPWTQLITDLEKNVKGNKNNK